MTPGPPLTRGAVDILRWAERTIFFLIGVLLFFAALALVMRSAQVLWLLYGGGAEMTIRFAARFLDYVLLILMVVELAYTVVLSLRGAVLAAEPFLIVGLIAVIRRILVITVGDVAAEGAGVNPSSVSGNATELAILTGVVIVFVSSIYLLRGRPPDPMTIEQHEEDVKSAKGGRAR